MLDFSFSCFQYYLFLSTYVTTQSHAACVLTRVTVSRCTDDDEAQSKFCIASTEGLQQAADPEMQCKGSRELYYYLGPFGITSSASQPSVIACASSTPLQYHVSTHAESGTAKVEQRTHLVATNSAHPSTPTAVSFLGS